MKIKYIKGDLFETSVPIIAHGCNAQGVMGSGVAKLVKEKYPQAFNAYREAYDKGPLKLGSMIFVDTGDKIIANCITQDGYGQTGQHVDYEAVRRSMRRLNKLKDYVSIPEVAMPMIGAGLGGGDWDTIAEIIEEELTSLTPFVYYL